VQEIADWLDKLGMSEYAQRFAENRIDFSVLPDLTDQDLEKMGVVLGDRRKILRAIAGLGDPGKAAQQTAAAAGISAASPHDAAERRQVTVMFSDLVGSTALSGRMDPEDLREVISGYQKCVTQTVQRFGGFVAKYMGDGVLVYFGYPQAHEDDAERAVRAELELVQAVSRLKSSDPLQTRVGIASGLVVVGDLIGSGEAHERGIESFPHQTPVILTYDIGDYDASLKKAMEIADYKEIDKRKRESARHGKLRGIGFSTYIEACGIAPSQAAGALGSGVGGWESAEVRVNPTGSVEVLTGSHSHGQGHETTFAQLVSDWLGIPMDKISVVHGDTDKVQFGMGTYGSRSGAVGMSAIVKALDKIEAKAKKVAAHMLEAAEGDIEFKDGKFSVAGTDKSAAWGDVSLNAYIAHKFSGQELEPGLKEGAFYDPTNHLPGRLPHLRGGGRSHTGHTEIVAWTAVDDFGVVINPMIVEGQVHGGVAQGVGQALCERAVYDKDGQLVTGSFMDYCMPRADHLPALEGRHHGHQMPLQSARHQGLRRSRRDCGTPGADQCHHRRDRDRGAGHAGDAAGGLGRPQASGRSKRDVMNRRSSLKCEPGR
jgi:Molybdopterin-binding domain of aldehyde dehydrogenase/SAM domain (Sterile alpha motif)/Adenylate and Guanylate cyclase catalytic domain